MKKVIRIGVLVSAFLFPSLLFAATFTTNLSLGSRGNDVRTVQQFLITRGLLTGTTTGYFSPQTKAAVQVFQKQNGLPSTGAWSSLTRKKAEALLLQNKQVAAPVTIISSTTPLTTASKVSSSVFSKNVLLKIIKVSQGYVISKEDNISCYEEEICSKTFPIDKKVTMIAIPREGYSFLGWSEASCGDNLSCSVTLVENTTVYARFGVKRLADSAMGKITSIQHPNDTCYILLGQDVCDQRLAFITNTAYDMTIKNDDDEYYVVGKDDTFWKTSDLDPEELAKSNAENASAVVYLGLFQGTHKISLNKGHTQILDSVNVNVKCSPGDFWEGARCWRKGASLLYVFKKNGYVIKSEPVGIRCGYNPEVCVMGFSSSTPVTLKVEVLPGYTFPGWYGDCSGLQLTCTLIMDKTKKVGIK